jgi:RNA polymerase sigma-70 factor, ECF subfamily
MVDDPDAPLVALARTGDRSATNELIVRHRASLAKLLAGRYLENPDDVAEIVQDTFVRAFERLGTFRGEGPFRAWLFRIGINLSLNRLDRQLPTEPLDLEDDRLFTNSLGTSRVVGADLRQRVHASICELPPKQRLVMELRLYHQMSFEEIGAVAGISSDAAKMNFHHGVKRLRDVMPEKK